MALISSVTNCPYIAQRGLGWLPPRLGSMHGALHRERDAEDREQAILISNVTVIYRLYFLGKWKDLFPGDRLFVNTQLPGVAMRVGKLAETYGFYQEEGQESRKELGPENTVSSAHQWAWVITAPFISLPHGAVSTLKIN